MDSSTIQYVLKDSSIDDVSGIPVASVVFMLYYGLELRHFLLDMSNEFMQRYPLRQQHVGSTSTYLSGSIAQGLYLNTRKHEQAKDVDIVTIVKKYPIKENCHYENASADEWLVKSRAEGDIGVCIPKSTMNTTSMECDDRYLNVKTLPDTPPGYVLLQKCRRNPLPVQTLEDLYVSSLKTTEARVQFWDESQAGLHGQYPHLPYRNDISSRKEGALLYEIEPHGPAATLHTFFPTEVDLVFALPYPLSWPTFANEWEKRQRPSGWPPQALVQEITSDGCTLIPKGSLGSQMEDFEWRVSFTGDLKLARSLSLVQREIMHILKAVMSEPQYNQEVRSKGINLTTEFESFQFLNLLYAESEKLTSDHWEPQKIANMLFYLIDKYLECFEQKHLSHYFIKARNILEKYNSISNEEINDVLYTLLRVRNDPLGQILQQRRFLRLTPHTHQMVYSQFVEQVKANAHAPQKLYVNTLVKLTKAHIVEGFYKYAVIYAQDTMDFFYGMEADTLSDEEYMDLMFTVALAYHRYGHRDQSLEYLEKLHLAIQKKPEEKLTAVFGQATHAHILAFYARVIVGFAKGGSKNLHEDEVIKKAKDLYDKAGGISNSNMSLLTDKLNSLILIGAKGEIEKVIEKGSTYFVQAKETTKSQPGEFYAFRLYEDSAYTGDHGSERQNEGKLEDEDSDHDLTEIGEQEKDSAFDSKTVEGSGESLSIDNSQKEEAHREILYDRKQISNERILELCNGGLNEVDTEILREYYRMKAWEALGLIERAALIRERLISKLNSQREISSIDSYEMLGSVYNWFENTFHRKEGPDPDSYFHDILGLYENHVIYTTADKPVLDEHIKELFNLADSTTILIPVKVMFLQLQIEFYKSQEDKSLVEDTLMQLKGVVSNLIPWTDTLYGQYLIACHMDWLGFKDEAKESIAIAKDRYSTIKELLDPPKLTDKIIDSIDNMFTIAADHEPHNKYLDDIFAV